MIEIVIPLLVIVVLVLLNGLFVAAEFAIIGVRPTRIEQLADAGDRTATGIRGILADPLRQDRYIATAQLGITAASLGLGMYGEHAVAGWLLGPLEGWLRLDDATAHTVAAIIAISLLTFAHVVVGEMIPKSLALQYAERTVLAIAGIMALIQRLLLPAVYALNAIGNGVMWLLRVPPPDRRGRLYTPEELELVVQESHHGGLMSDNQQQLIENIFDFGDRQVVQVMTPRTRVVALSIDSSAEEVLALLAASSHSRFPVYQGDLDHVLGLVLLKDIIRQHRQQPGVIELRALLRHLPVVPETMPVATLLAAFKRARQHMALVMDEYGGTAGVVTLEDLMEEVVGEVHDEFEQGDVAPLTAAGPGIFLARGDLLLDDLRQEAPHAVPDEADLPDVETVGGLVMTMLGRPARAGDVVEARGARLTVERAVGPAVALVRIEVAAGATAPDPPMAGPPARDDHA
jgi:CBS domain containing-hemolysin-like protein